jgi:hypothetical protein
MVMVQMRTVAATLTLYEQLAVAVILTVCTLQ